MVGLTDTARHNRRMPTPSPAATATTHLARNVAALRHARGLTQRDLAAAAAVPRSTVTSLESGTGNPSLQSLLKVAHALAVPLDELLAAPRAAVRLWRATEFTPRHKGHGVTLRSLVPEPVPNEQMELMTLDAGAVMTGTPHLPATREYFTCLDGEAALIVAGEMHTLQAGDTLAFPGHLPHSYLNRTSAPARGVSLVVWDGSGSGRGACAPPSAA
jgi:transcriptional regulator with XRE-family HTH domain